MTDDRPPWLEDPDEYEGVGADPRNPRYDPVDEVTGTIDAAD